MFLLEMRRAAILVELGVFLDILLAEAYNGDLPILIWWSLRLDWRWRNHCVGLLSSPDVSPANVRHHSVTEAEL